MNLRKLLANAFCMVVGAASGSFWRPEYLLLHAAGFASVCWVSLSTAGRIVWIVGSAADWMQTAKSLTYPRQSTRSATYSIVAGVSCQSTSTPGVIMYLRMA